MPKQKPNSYKRLRPSRGRPPAASAQSSNFPAVGMTLSTYRQAGATSVAIPRSAPPPPKPGRLRRLRQAVTLKRAVITLFLLVLLTGGYVAAKLGYNLHRLFGGNPFSIFTTTKLKGEDSGRVNILLAGYSNDDPGHSGAQLTDSIMILSVDTKNQTAFMLSVPRDLYVKYDTYGCSAGDAGKINAVYECGQWLNFSEAGYPSGGMGQLEKVVSSDFGIPIDYYALIDYTAIRDAVNAVGGIDINIQSSDPRGIYDPDIDYATHPHTLLVPKLANGWHHFDGEQALDLARARGDAYGSYGVTSDFDRTMYQREMLIALKSKAASAGVVTNPVRLTQLFDSVGANVKTDLQLPDVHRLYDLTKGINPNSIQSVGLNNVNGQNLLTGYTMSDGESALVPAAGTYDYSGIQALMERLTSNNPVVKEAATITLLNGTDSYGLAAKQQKVLESKYLSVAQVGNAAGVQTTTLIIDNSNGKKPATLQLLKNLYGNNVTTTNTYNYTTDFIVVIGSDQLAQ